MTNKTKKVPIDIPIQSPQEVPVKETKPTPAEVPIQAPVEFPLAK